MIHTIHPPPFPSRTHPLPSSSTHTVQRPNMLLTHHHPPSLFTMPHHHNPCMSTPSLFTHVHTITCPPSLFTHAHIHTRNPQLPLAAGSVQGKGVLSCEDSIILKFYLDSRLLTVLMATVPTAIAQVLTVLMAISYSPSPTVLMVISYSPSPYSPDGY